MIKKIFINLFITLSLVGCAQKISSKGIYQKPEDLAKIRLNISTKSDVQNILGTPIVTSYFTDNDFFYIGETISMPIFTSNKVLKSTVIKISFNQKGVVSKMDSYNLNEMKKVDLTSGKRTVIEGSEISAINQILGNIGRFDSAASKNRAV